MENKSDLISIKNRNKGNVLFRKGEFFHAIVAYNKAICYAETNQELAFAFANRSSAFLEQRKYKECLSNIQWARDYNYPADKMKKLEERETQCKELMASGEKHPDDIPDDFFELAQPANPKIPFITAGLEVRKTGKNNDERGIFTTRDLNPGDVVAIEELIIKLVDGGYGQVDYCYNCTKINMMNLIPCKKTASLMFCSVTCRDQFHETFDSSNLMHSEMRKMVREAKEVFGGIENFAEFTWERPDRNKTYFDYDFSDPNDPKYREKLWKASFAMMGLIDGINAPSKVSSIIEENSMVDLFCRHFVRWLGAKEKLEDYNKTKCPVSFNHGYFLLFGLMRIMQHSCVANTKCFYYDGNKMVYMIIRPIKAGEQLFWDQLSNDFTVLSKQRRTEELLKRRIKCNCYACENDLTTEKLQVINSLIIARAGRIQFDLTWRHNNNLGIYNMLKEVEFFQKAICFYSYNPLSKELAVSINVYEKLIEILAICATHPSKALIACHCCITEALNNNDDE